MRNTHKVAYDYAMNMKVQRVNEQRVHEALTTLCGDNQVFSLAEPIELGYTRLVQATIGEDLFDWLCWWMYETEYGDKDMEFCINDTCYDPTEMTLYKFLELVDDEEDTSN